MLNHFQSVVRALGLLSVGKGDCQGVLLAVLKAIREQAAELLKNVIFRWRPASWRVYASRLNRD